MQSEVSDRLGTRATQLVTKGEALLADKKPPPRNVAGQATVSLAKFNEWRSQALAFLTALADAVPAARSYRDDFADRVTAQYAGDTDRGIGILRAVAEDIAAGDLYRVQQLVAAEVFSDFIDMAQHLCEAGYDAPAASLAGAVLEEGLRGLVAQHGGSAKNLESASHLLFQASVLNPMSFKQVKVWIEIRNAADHGQFEELEHSAVASMVAGVRDLLARLS